MLSSLLLCFSSQTHNFFGWKNESSSKFFQKVHEFLQVICWQCVCLIARLCKVLVRKFIWFHCFWLWSCLTVCLPLQLRTYKLQNTNCVAEKFATFVFQKNNNQPTSKDSLKEKLKFNPKKFKNSIHHHPRCVNSKQTLFPKLFFFCLYTLSHISVTLSPWLFY